MFISGASAARFQFYRKFIVHGKPTAIYPGADPCVGMIEISEGNPMY
jgi:hypothetical protein